MASSPPRRPPRSRARFSILEPPAARSSRPSAVVYGFAPGPVGTVLIARTDRGLCRVAILDETPHAKVSARARTRAIADLRSGWPDCPLTRDDATARSIARAVFDPARASRVTEAIELDLAGTAFQRSVWRALLAIPPGQTTTYRKIAVALCRPRAARAVGNAVGRNPVGILVPCHRVVREDGSLGGFAWGPRMKRALLDRERGLTQPPR